MLNLSYPDQVYSSQNPPSNETLKADLSLIEAGHNALETEVSAVTETSIPSIASQISAGWIPVVGSWTYASADAPTFTITVPSGAASLYSVGMRIKLTQNTVKYFIITAVADTGTLTVYGGTDYTLVSADISDISYSTQKAPFGFPLNPKKWTVSSSAINVSQASPTANQYYNKATYAVPIGAWRIYLEGGLYGERNTSGVNEVWAGLGTANNNVNLLKLIFSTWLITGGGSITASEEFYVELSSKTNYYLNIGTASAGIGTIAFGNVSTGYFRAVCAYL